MLYVGFKTASWTSSPSGLQTFITQTVVINIICISINIIHSIFLAKGFQMKNQPPLVPVAKSNSGEVKKVDIPVPGEDSVDSKKTDDGTSDASIKINPYGKVKGMGPGVWVPMLFRV